MTPKLPKPIPLAHHLATVSIGLFLIAFGAFFTLAAPVHVFFLKRTEPHRADFLVEKRLLFFIPFKRDSARGIESASYEVRSPKPSGIGEGGGETESHGYIVLKNDKGEVASIEMSPANVDEKMNRINRFIYQETAPSLRFWAVSNWKFGILAPGLISILGCFFILLVVQYVIVQYLKKLLSVRSNANSNNSFFK